MKIVLLCLCITALVAGLIRLGIEVAEYFERRIVKRNIANRVKQLALEKEEAHQRELEMMTPYASKMHVPWPAPTSKTVKVPIRNEVKPKDDDDDGISPLLAFGAGALVGSAIGISGEKTREAGSFDGDGGTFGGGGASGGWDSNSSTSSGESSSFSDDSGSSPDFSSSSDS